MKEEKLIDDLSIIEKTAFGIIDKKSHLDKGEMQDLKYQAEMYIKKSYELYKMKGTEPGKKFNTAEQRLYDDMAGRFDEFRKTNEKSDFETYLENAKKFIKDSTIYMSQEQEKLNDRRKVVDLSRNIERGYEWYKMKGTEPGKKFNTAEQRLYDDMAGRFDEFRKTNEKSDFETYLENAKKFIKDSTIYMSQEQEKLNDRSKVAVLWENISVKLSNTLEHVCNLMKGKQREESQSKNTYTEREHKKANPSTDRSR